MSYNLVINNNNFSTEISAIAEGNPNSSFDIVIQCRNHQMELVLNKINEFALEIFLGFEVLVDARVRHFYLAGQNGRFHATITGSVNQLHDFRDKFILVQE